MNFSQGLSYSLGLSHRSLGDYGNTVNVNEIGMLRLWRLRECEDQAVNLLAQTCS